MSYQNRYDTKSSNQSVLIKNNEIFCWRSRKGQIFNLPFCFQVCILSKVGLLKIRFHDFFGFEETFQVSWIPQPQAGNPQRHLRAVISKIFPL